MKTLLQQLGEKIEKLPVTDHLNITFSHKYTSEEIIQSAEEARATFSDEELMEAKGQCHYSPMYPL